MSKTTFWIIVIGLLVVAQPARLEAQTRTLEERVTHLEQGVRRMDTLLSIGLIAAVMCAWWAQNSGRNAVLWFLAGLIFSVISLFVLLYKNAADLRARGPARPPPGT